MEAHLLNDIQFNLYNKANIFLEKNTHSVDKFDDFQKIIKQGGFILAHWDGTEETEMKIKKLTKATIRCIPFDNFEDGKCIMTGNPSKQRVLFAKAY